MVPDFVSDTDMCCPWQGPDGGFLAQAVICHDRVQRSLLGKVSPDFSGEIACARTFFLGGGFLFGNPIFPMNVDGAR